MENICGGTIEGDMKSDIHSTFSSSKMLLFIHVRVRTHGKKHRPHGPVSIRQFYCSTVQVGLCLRWTVAREHCAYAMMSCSLLSVEPCTRTNENSWHGVSYEDEVALPPTREIACCNARSVLLWAQSCCSELQRTEFPRVLIRAAALFLPDAISGYSFLFHPLYGSVLVAELPLCRYRWRIPHSSWMLTRTIR